MDAKTEKRIKRVLWFLDRKNFLPKDNPCPHPMVEDGFEEPLLPIWTMMRISMPGNWTPM